MKYALINSVKHEAVKGMQGICPSCGSEMIARCGTLKVHHWAHKHKHQCDRWWEPETEWHRAWKGHYPENWQEIVMPDPSTGEKHIADVQTDNGLVLEFQHSPIHVDERTSRERFYKNMVWVVDGCRSKRELKRFLDNRESLYFIDDKGLYRSKHPDEVFPYQWLNSTVPVVFDFGLADPTEAAPDLKSSLWCLLNVKLGNDPVVAKVTKTAFIKATLNGNWSIRQASLIESINSINTANQRNSVAHNGPPRESSHYYDPKRKKMVKKWRF